MPVARARKATDPGKEQPAAMEPAANAPPLVAKGYTAYGGRCRRGGQEGFLQA